jgi:FSR family fosmidomycin resistance protein-like MFS transporter
MHQDYRLTTKNPVRTPARKIHSGGDIHPGGYQIVLWGLLHGLNDFAAGFMLSSYTYTHTADKSFLFIVIYSIIGFGGQLPVGFLVDHKKQLRPFAAASLILLPASILLFFVNAEIAIIFSGIASAFVHVTGGTVCLLQQSSKSENKAGPLALFTAPGVLGLTIGGLIGKFSVFGLPAGPWWWFVVAGALIIGWMIWKNELPNYKTAEKKQSELDAHDFIMLSILLVMCFRSFIFDIINHVAHDYENGILIIGVSAFLGKVIGGFVADRIGWKRFIYISLPIALLLFQFGKENIYALAFGIACLQSSVPITLLLMSRSLPLYPATATALSLGTSIALAGLPLYMISEKKILLSGFNNPWITAIIFVLLFICWILADKMLRKKLIPPV